MVCHGLLPSSDNGTFNGVVPDGVASVTLRFPARHGLPAASGTARGTENMWVLRIAGAPSDPHRSADDDLALGRRARHQDDRPAGPDDRSGP